MTDRCRDLGSEIATAVVATGAVLCCNMSQVVFASKTATILSPATERTTLVALSKRPRLPACDSNAPTVEGCGCHSTAVRFERSNAIQYAAARGIKVHLLQPNHLVEREEGAPSRRFWVRHRMECAVQLRYERLLVTEEEAKLDGVASEQAPQSPNRQSHQHPLHHLRGKPWSSDLEIEIREMPSLLTVLACYAAS